MKVVDSAKLRDCLLPPEHPVCRAKARLCTAVGFARDRWPELQQALLAHAAISEAEPGAAIPYGQKYIAQGILHGPAGCPVPIVSVWIILVDEEIPRFVTAYP